MMIHAEGALRKSGPGLPNKEDFEQVVGYVDERLAMGLNMTEACHGGLEIHRYRPGPDGAQVLTVVRKISAQTLERRYRRFRSELDEADAWRKAEPCLANARYRGVAAAWPPAVFGEKSLLKRGRPRRNPKR